MDVVASSFRDMDVEYERCVKKAVINSDQKTNWGDFLLVPFSLFV